MLNAGIAGHGFCMKNNGYKTGHRFCIKCNVCIAGQGFCMKNNVCNAGHGFCMKSHVYNDGHRFYMKSNVCNVGRFCMKNNVWFKHILLLNFKLTCKTYIHTITIYRIGTKA